MLSAVSLLNNSLIKSKRFFSFRDSYSTGFLSDAVLKIDCVPSLFILSRFDKSDIKIRPVGAHSVADYLFFSNMFSIFFSNSNQLGFYSFSIDNLKTLQAFSNLSSRIRFQLPRYSSFFNFFYFFLFYYLPKVANVGSTISDFSYCMVFPDFSLYGDYFGRLTTIYPHYAIIMKRVGLFIFLDEFKLKFNFNVSSYLLRSMYLSYFQSSDWSLKFHVYYGLKIRESSLIDFFKLQRSYFKFFVVGKNGI